MLLARGGLIAGSLALAALAAVTTSFTWQADLVTALAFGLVVTGFAIRLARPATAPAGTLSSGEPRGPAWSPARRWLPWVIAVGAAVSWELFSYLSAPRVAHPTLSSMADSLTHRPVSRGLLFLAYLALGWYLARG